MKHVTLILSCLLFVMSALAQRPPASNVFQFPEGQSEFVVDFPSKPSIEILYGAERSGRQAELALTASSFVRAESSHLPPEQIGTLKQMSDEDLSKIPLGYAKNIALENSVVSVEKTKFGRCVKLRGYKTISGIEIRYEVYMYVGETDVIGLYVAFPSSSIPPPSILRFLNSFRKRL